jgi:hypothetical protein
MYQRNISAHEVRHAIDTGETVEDYPDDTPYPSRLVLGWSDRRPIHVVVADNVDEQENVVITAYEPDPSEWEPDFKWRKTS